MYKAKIYHLTSDRTKSGIFGGLKFCLYNEKSVYFSSILREFIFLFGLKRIPYKFLKKVCARYVIKEYFPNGSEF